MPREADLQREALLLWGAHPSVRLWRANAGRALVATATGGLRSVQMNVPGCSDAIGWVSVPASRLGARSVAVFTGLEFKSDTGQVREAQSAFGAVLTRMGGLYVLARSMDDVDRGIGGLLG